MASRMSTQASSARPWRRSATMRPKLRMRVKGNSRMARHSSKFARGVGFSRAEAEFAPLKPPPLVPSCLMATWEAWGLHGLVALEGLGHALGSQGYGKHEGEGQKHTEDHADHIGEEVPEPPVAGRPQSPHEGEGHGNAHGRGQEVLHGQARGLGQVAEVRLPRHGLPIGVGREAHGHVQGRIGGQPPEALGVGGQGPLGHEQQEQPRDGHPRKGHDAHQIAPPAHGIVRVHPQKAEGAALHRADDAAGPGLAPLHHVHEVAGKRHRAGHQQGPVGRRREQGRAHLPTHRPSPSLNSSTARYTIAARASTPTAAVTYAMALPFRSGPRRAAPSQAVRCRSRPSAPDGT